MVVIGGVALYFSGVLEAKKTSSPSQPKDLTGIIVPPVMFSMRDKTFVVPESDLVVSLNLISPSSRHDYPMARFTTASGVNGTLVAYDDFATQPEAGYQVVPIGLSYETGKNDVFLAILEVTDSGVTHVSSLPIGFNPTIRTVNRSGNQVTVTYAVHDRTQIPGEPPRVETTAIFDIATNAVVQAGRDPRTEIPKVVKNFKGSYLWKETEKSDGSIVTPVVPNTYTLTFDANRISLGTDCNSGGAEFTPPEASSTELVFGAIAATEMFCEKTQESEYFQMIAAVKKYTEHSSGVLEFGLDGGGTMTFIPKDTPVPFEESQTGVTDPDSPVASPS